MRGRSELLVNIQRRKPGTVEKRSTAPDHGYVGGAPTPPFSLAPLEFDLSNKLTTAFSLTSVGGTAGGNPLEEKLKEEREKTDTERRKNGRSDPDSRAPALLRYISIIILLVFIVNSLIYLQKSSSASLRRLRKS